MKVTFFTRDYANVSGGHNTWLCRFLPTLRERGLESRVLCFQSSQEEFPTARSLRQAGFSCTTASESELKYTKQRMRWIFARLQEDPPDVFVINAVYPPAYYAGRWLRKAGIPTVGICHGGGMMNFYPGLLDKFVLGRAAYQVAAFVCVLKGLEEAVRARHPQRILIQTIPCGVAIQERMAQKPSGRLRLAYVGRLVEEQKRISEVTRALCRAVREVKGTEAKIYGDGPARANVEQILRAEGKGLPVQLVGFVEHAQLLQHLLKCHAVVLLSDYEGLGLALLEGMACGVVPIGLHGAPCVTEFVADSVNGLLVGDRGDEFVAAVRRLRDDPQLWERLARAAHAKAIEFSVAACADHWQELLHTLVNSSGPRQPLQIPRWLHLPPVHPALSWLDPRPNQELMRRARRFAGFLSHFWT